ncbi:MAG: hypothetical protein COW24_02150 [Candidatus Kerfeldbacteria bacterium CG15_BIG_FIL_POST_REV_8_21_14_020_45_12]|uniref:Right handed beta helix domain-containing protein n=1 Tax=Candidatus Kerfeldbacteria bacterium CG15_BIG_FIL_POST_REV_8_21_14_020_45_12 TaxID=2014247 RepID=A0A2M7H496_9BACT|nr:MAG: hypothetical protein COW24_02150 [Candidatus Kerfeldbacteria bacterium CG15_BIG_FIL_POST_REV_8_21_14_020_45_12]PJA94045.1 MAG: hypothetical protein CO132_00225 [Candidatus Kerfeldbacteria bacterium CG_4_9_14_3_um_filter_45_8]
MIRHIHSHHQAIQKGEYSRVKTAVASFKLFFLYVAFGAHRALHLLFSPAEKSYALFHDQSAEDAFVAELEAHRRFKRGARVASVTSPLVIVAAALIVTGITQSIFPVSDIKIAHAADNLCTVNNSNDVGAGSLRDCITDANSQAAGVRTVITIDLAGNQTLTLGSKLSNIQRPVTIEPAGSVINLTIDGSGIGAGDACLSLVAGADDSILTGFSLTDCGRAIVLSGVSGVELGQGSDEDGRITIAGGVTGIELDDSADSNTITNAWIGFDKTQAAQPITGIALDIAGDSNTLTRIIEGNANVGFNISGDSNTVSRSFIGTSPSAANVGNSEEGVFVSGDSNVIGGSDNTTSNFIGNNGKSGVYISKAGLTSPTNNILYQNVIGADVSGDAAPNLEDGLKIDSASNTTIGNSVSGMGPSIAGNALNGISITNSDTVSITNSKIGLGQFGAVAGSSQDIGVYVSNSTDVSIEDNVIGNNGESGITMDSGSTGVISGNSLGKTIAAAAGNGTYGIYLYGPGSVTVGTESAPNTIVNNGAAGILIENPMSDADIVVQYNYIGTSSSPNQGPGITVDTTSADTSVTLEANEIIGNDDGQATAHGILLNEVFGTTEINGNAITSNSGNGLEVVDSSWVKISNNFVGSNIYGVRISGSTSLKVANNYIGVLSDGTTAAANTAGGVLITESSSGVIIGATISAGRNIIVNNAGDGVHVDAEARSSNLILNNYIGLGADGVLASGNSGDGVYIGAAGQTVSDNVISNNAINGINVEASGVTISDNLIGWDAGKTTLSQRYGIRLAADSATVSSNAIAGSVQGIRVEESTDHNITENSVKLSTGDGIALYAVTSSTLNNNVVADSVLQGVRIAGGSELVFTGNAITQNLKNGISVGAGAVDVRIGPKISDSDKTARYNTFSGNGKYGVVVADSASARIQITQNLYSNNGSGPTYINPSSNSGLSSPVITNVLSKKVEGTGAVKGGSVQVYSGAGVFLGQTTDTEAGGWVVKLQQAINSLTASLAAQIIDASGNTSAFSNQQDFDVSDGAVIEADGDANFTISVTASAGKNDALIEARTTQSTSATVSYGKDEHNLANSVSGDVIGTYHSLELTNLAASTTYYFKVVATGDTGATASYSGSFKTTVIDAQYLTKYTSVNNIPVFNPKEVVYVAPNKQVTVAVDQVPEEHEVQLRLQKADGTGKVKTTFRSGGNGKAQGKFDVLKNETYKAEAKARLAANTKKNTGFVAIAKIQPTAKAPIITSLNGSYTVTGDSRSLEFAGDAGARSGNFRIINSITGVLVAEGQTDSDGIYELPFDLAVGQYTVYFEGVMKGGKKTAPAVHQLTVINPRYTTTVLNTDTRSTDYFNRLVQGQVTVVGVSDRAGIIYIDGAQVGLISVEDGISWSTNLDLNALGISAGDHMLEIQYLNQNGSAWGSRVEYPFKRAENLVTPVITQSSTTALKGSVLSANILAGNGYRLNVYEDGTLIASESVVSSDGGVIGGVVLTLPTDQLGSFTWSVEAENSLGTRTTAQDISWSVVAPSIVSTPSDETVSETPVIDDTADIEDPATETPVEPNTDTEVDPADGDGTQPERSIPGVVGEDNSLTVLPDDVNPEDIDVVAEELISVPADQVDSLTDDEIETIGKINKVLINLPDYLKPQRKSQVAATTDIRIIAIPGEEVGDVPAQYLEIETDETEIAAIKSRLEEENFESLNIELTESQTDPVTGELISSGVVEPNQAGVRVMRKQVSIGLPSLSELFSGKAPVQVEQKVELTGRAEPYSKAKLAIFSDPIVKVTRADDTGEWVLNVDVNELPEGEHTAYFQSESRGVASDEIEIARFVVVEEQHISNTTWIFIINMVVAMVLLVVVISMQIRKHTNGGGTPPAAGKSYTSDSSIGGLESHTLPLKDNSNSPPSSGGGALGV